MRHFVPALAVALASTLAVPSRAAFVDVGSDPVNCDFTDLNTALAFAADFDVLRIEAGTWTGAAGVNFNLVSKSLWLAGGYASGCDGTLPLLQSRTVLQGGGGDTVLEISGGGSHTVRLQRLQLRGGADDADDGGGLGISGDFDVVLENVGLSLNASERGAGIYLDGSAGATLELHGVDFGKNAATLDGGGLYCLGAEVRIEQASFSTNTAGRDGGGIWASDCAISTDAVSPFLTVTGNDAVRDGGGLYQEGSSTTALSRGAAGELLFEGNEAGGDGGGAIVVDPGADCATLELEGATVAANEAGGSGGGLFARGSCSDVLLLAPGSRLLDNVAGGAGGGVAGSDFADAVLIDVEAAFNQAPEGAFAAGFLDLVVLGSLVHDSSAPAGAAVHLEPGSDADFEETTFAANDVVASIRVGTDVDVEAEAMIFADSGPPFTGIVAGVQLSCAVVPPGSGLPPASSGVLMATPAFTADFHLAAGSPGIDLCAAPCESASDRDGDPRPFGAACDAGADEWTGEIFRDGFESGDAAAWTSATS